MKPTHKFSRNRLFLVPTLRDFSGFWALDCPSLNNQKLKHFRISFQQVTDKSVLRRVPHSPSEGPVRLNPVARGCDLLIQVYFYGLSPLTLPVPSLLPGIPSQMNALHPCLSFREPEGFSTSCLTRPSESHVRGESATWLAGCLLLQCQRLHYPFGKVCFCMVSFGL